MGIKKLIIFFVLFIFIYGCRTESVKPVDIVESDVQNSEVHTDKITTEEPDSQEAVVIRATDIVPVEEEQILYWLQTRNSRLNLHIDDKRFD
ncbi:hypothetical protein GF327_05685 [Candidatus Woesearchaeota archaeon]|nr:hypothetical protein [Candidatus Woesearchaeota archaeon]